MPPWAGPPRARSPGIVALELFLVHTDRHAGWINHAEVYPEGLALEVHLHGREEARRGVETGPGTWRFGFQFSDGRKAISYGLGMFARVPGHWAASSAQATAVGRSISAAGAGSLSPPEEPVFRALGGGGSRRAWRQRYWLWPLPPAGELLVACEWPDLGIEFATQTINADRLLAAADRARPLWPADNTPPAAR